MKYLQNYTTKAIIYQYSIMSAAVFIRPGEEEVANSGKDWNKNRKESMKTYFKDCASIIDTVEKDDWCKVLFLLLA